MAHGRKELRDAIVTTLTNASITGSRVYSNRYLALSADDLPAINVISVEETASPLSVSQKKSKRELAIHVAIIAKENDSGSIDDTLDTLADSVEAAMTADETFGGKCVLSNLTGTSFEVSTEAETNVGTAKLAYKFVYIY